MSLLSQKINYNTYNIITIYVNENAELWPLEWYLRVLRRFRYWTHRKITILLTRNEVRRA